MNITTITLFRPTGQNELNLVAESGFTKWPARLPEQPFFYPVTNFEYAAEIARNWNTKDKENGAIGYVTKFSVTKKFISHYATHQVGAQHHTEYWIPAEDLELLNQNIVGNIEIIAKFEAEEK